MCAWTALLGWDKHLGDIRGLLMTSSCRCLINRADREHVPLQPCAGHRDLRGPCSGGPLKGRTQWLTQVLWVSRGSGEPWGLPRR